MKVTVTVTMRDIARAVDARQDPGYIAPSQCPIALALKRHHPGGPHSVVTWHVAEDDAYLAVNYPPEPEYMRHHSHAVLPAEAVEFIQRFDGKERVQPLTFALDFQLVSGREPAFG